MRVIAGEAKGLKLKVPKGYATRPTAGKVREAIFSSVSNNIAGAYVLDLFAGSGALGIEALSRQAEFVFFIDSSIKAVETIRSNIRHTGFESQGQIIKSDAQTFLKKYDNRFFDLIFIDAPYKIGLTKMEGIINLAFDVLAGGGILIVEHSNSLTLTPNNRIYQEKKYGQTLVTFFYKD